MAQVMLGKDAVAGSLAECFITINGTRYNFMQIYKFEAKMEKNKIEVPILGKTGKGNKANGWSGTFTGTAHYNQSIMREMLIKYMETGEDTYFDIQVTNEDPTTSVGRQTVIYNDCNLDGGIMSKFDASSDFLDEEISGTFEKCVMPESFSMLTGMI